MPADKRIKRIRMFGILAGIFSFGVIFELVSGYVIGHETGVFIDTVVAAFFLFLFFENRHLYKMENEGK